MTDFEPSADDEEADEILIAADPEIADLIPGYIESRREDVVRMAEAVERADFAAVAKTAQRICGSAGSCGLEDLALGKRA